MKNILVMTLSECENDDDATRRDKLGVELPQ